MRPEGASYRPGPERFEAGLQNCAGIAGLRHAIEYLERIGQDAVSEHERRLTRRLDEGLRRYDDVTMFGPPAAQRGGIRSVAFRGIGGALADPGRVKESRTGRALRRAIAVAVIGALTVGARVDGATSRSGRLQACFVGLNEPDEADVFRSHLDLDRFELVDIPPPARIEGGGATPTGWLLDACSARLRCDLVVVSGEFAGGFFGKGGSLSLQAMEEASCQQRCAGLFRQPREVFLLACNTLASKDQDSRTPEIYLQVLLEHGFDRALAERVVELRYGPLGPSFRESLRRIFAGVPHLYGFSSVAPRAEYSAPMLERYLRGTPDYALALGRETGRNAALRAAFAGTSLTETTGIVATEAGARDRDYICALYDESRSLAERLLIAYGLILRPDALRFIPTLQIFLSRHPPESFTRTERSVFVGIQTADSARDAVLELVDRLEVSALRLELAHFAALVGWLEPAELHILAAEGAAQLLRRSLTSEAVDVMCEITKHASLRDDFTADDIPAQLYVDAEGLRLLACLAPADPRVGSRMLPALRSPDPVQRQWAAYALTQLRPSDPRVLAELVPYLHDPSPEIAARIRWLLQVQAPALARSSGH